MPILNVSDSVMKYALESIRIPISILGDCPQCQGNGFRDGICPDCGFIHPNVQAAIQAWQAAMGIQQTAEQMKQRPKAAYKSATVADILPSVSKNKECPGCGDSTFDGISCNSPRCTYKQAPEGARFNRPKFLGIDDKWRKKIDKGFNFLSPAGVMIEKTKTKLKATAAKQQQQQQPMDLGALQDDSMNAHNDATTRMKDMLQQSAQMDAQQNYQNNQTNANNSEEQQ